MKTIRRVANRMPKPPETAIKMISRVVREARMGPNRGIVADGANLILGSLIESSLGIWATIFGDPNSDDFDRIPLAEAAIRDLLN